MHVIAIVGKCVCECVWYAFILNAMSFLTQIVFIRPQTVSERIVELWNSSAFNPSAPSSSCHKDFMSSTDCSYDLVSAHIPASPQRIQDFFTSMRSDLVRIVSNWETSGQGDGGRDNHEESPVDMDTTSFSSGEDEPSYGALCNRPPRALDTRAAFLNGSPSFLLYFWELANTHQLLASALQQLNDTSGATSASSAPVVSSSRSRSITSSGGSRATGGSHGRQQRDEEASLAKSLQHIADSQDRMLLDHDIDRDHERKENSRKRRFGRRSRLMDEARRFRKEIAELTGLVDDRSQQMLHFYTSEVVKLDEDIVRMETERAD